MFFTYSRAQITYWPSTSALKLHIWKTKPSESRIHREYHIWTKILKIPTNSIYIGKQCRKLLLYCEAKNKLKRPQPAQPGGKAKPPPGRQPGGKARPPPGCQPGGEMKGRSLWTRGPQVWPHDQSGGKLLGTQPRLPPPPADSEVKNRHRHGLTFRTRHLRTVRDDGSRGVNTNADWLYETCVQELIRRRGSLEVRAHPLDLARRRAWRPRSRAKQRTLERRALIPRQPCGRGSVGLGEGSGHVWARIPSRQLVKCAWFEIT
jgi:hypothetical protein